jgi:hypothetical protein
VSLRGPAAGGGVVHSLPQAGVEENEARIRRGLRKAKYLASEEKPGKASQVLEQVAGNRQGVLPWTAEIGQKLRAQHPRASSAPISPPDWAPTSVPVHFASLKKAADRISNGSAPDLFGWTGELVRHLVRDRQTGPLVARLVEAIRDGRVPAEAREWLLASWLLPLDKGDSNPRPTGGTIFVKLAGAYLMTTATTDVKKLFRESGTQCGVFTPDGTTAAIHYTQNALDLDPSHIVLKVDFSNAFNSLSRKTLMHEFYQYPQLAPFYRLLYWAYSESSALLVRGDGGLVDCLESAEGVRQGCVLGPLAYTVPP